MLAPNGQPFFPAHDDWEATFACARDVLGRCSDLFENAVDGKSLRFELHVGDSIVLAALYEKRAKLLTGKFVLFANQVLGAIRMPYRISSVVCVVTNPAVMYCSVRRETFNDIVERMGEVG